MEKIKFDFEEVFSVATVNLSKSLLKYYPARDKNTPAERNLTHQIALAFSNIYPADSNIFFEIPFDNKIIEKFDNHFDSFIFNKNTGIILESKRLLKYTENLVEIKNDITRMEKNYSKILDQFLVSNRPKHFYTCILVLAWKHNHLTKLSKIDELKEYETNIKSIVTYINDTPPSELFWLYAIKKVV